MLLRLSPLLLCWSVLAGAQEQPGIDALEWLAGCWDGQSDTAASEECWSEPAGGLMLGYGRVVREGRPAGFEFLRLVESGGQILFIAQPGGVASTEFQARVIESDFARFVNPEHDYPRVIEYRRAGDQLTAAIGEGLTIETSESVNRFRFVLRDD